MNKDSFFSPIEVEELNSKISIFKRNRKPFFYNFYGATDGYRYDFVESNDSILVRKNEDGFFRLYVCSVDSNDLVYYLSQLDKEKYVINIPTKSQMDDWNKLLIESGFHFYARYDRYYNTNVEYRESEIGVYAQLEDVDDIMKLIGNDEFSIYTDYLPTAAEVMKMIENRQVIVNKSENKVLGVIIYTIEGRKCYLNLWIDRSGEGLYLLFDVYNYMAENGLKYAYFWIRSTNKKVIKMV